MIRAVFYEIRKPSGGHPGHVLEGFFTFENETVLLVNCNGKALKDAQGGTFSKKPGPGENPKSVVRRLLKQHYTATRHKSVSRFDGPIFYPKFKRA